MSTVKAQSLNPNTSLMSTNPTPNFMTTVLSEQPLTHSNYPKVHFWFRKDWINQKKEKLGVIKVNESLTTGDKG